MSNRIDHNAINNFGIEEQERLLTMLKYRFEKHLYRHPEIDWSAVEKRLEKKTEKLWSLYLMELTGGEPDVVAYDEQTDEYIFYDCVKESPKGRRSICYDIEALESRKKYKPDHSAIGMAQEMGIEILTEEQYRMLQRLGDFDTTTSSWIKTPTEIRKMGGAIFADFRYGNVFVYHNGAESYYSSRGFRGLLRV